jgi:hypothetical protein
MLLLRRTPTVLILLAMAASAIAQAGNPLSGKWSINLAKSKNSPANLALKSSTSVSRDGKTRTNTVTGTDAQGRTINNTVVYEKR